MITLFGRECYLCKFIANILVHKGVRFRRVPEPHPQSEADVVLEDHDLLLDDPVVIADYLENRCPAPPLLSPEIERRSVTLTLVTKILKGQIDLPKLTNYLKQRRPFVLGADVCLLDLAIEPHVNDTQYTEDLLAAAEGIVF
jgi:glutathione S-transferase